MNDHFLSLIPGEEKVYLGSDSICESKGLNDNFNESLYSPDVLNGMKLAGLANHRLGIEELGDRAIKAEILIETKVGETVSLTRFKLTPSDKRLPLQVNRRQFPKYAYIAMTMNKSQGQSLLKVGIYLPKLVFIHGQMYVVVSRVTSQKGLKMLIYNKDARMISETRTQLCTITKRIIQRLSMSVKYAILDTNVLIHRDKRPTCYTRMQTAKEVKAHPHGGVVVKRKGT
ncbi:ATP-dependent DNA helicase PIF1-like protein [Tanacetum coccineum]